MKWYNRKKGYSVKSGLKTIIYTIVKKEKQRKVI